MNFFVYILISQSNSQFYIGQTQDLSARIILYNANKVPSTKNRGPWSIYFSIRVESRSQAIMLEKKLKNIKSRKRIITWVQLNNS